MKKIILISTLCLLLAGSALAYEYSGGKCTGSKNCSACKNCKYCKHCAKEGGTCGVCK
ncbi:hypothetical protein [Flavobacterium sp. UBA6046]|uniref:hypothetical protein n=1 Tax=Flavobacterium sp. UBA6046 TaxID=1946552 RepID=UPI0025BA97E2|nr:hypothetical protein [Flavobacterium sp. UBA6046]